MALVGSDWAGLDRVRPDTWQAMVMPRRSLRPPLGRGPRLADVSVAHGRPRRAGPWTVGGVLGGPSPPFSSLAGSMYTGCMRMRSARGIPLLPLPAYSHRRRAPGEPCQRCWRPIEVGKGLARPRRTRWWGLGDCQGFLRLWPWWSVARRGGACRRAPSSGAGVQLKWATARPYHGGCPREASEVAGQLQTVGRGGGARRSSGQGPMLVAGVLRSAIDDSVYAAVLQTSL